MTVELQMLVASSLLAIVGAFPNLIAVIWQGGLGVALGNRDNVPQLPQWAIRAERAQRNLLANLIPFAALVLVAHLSGLSNAETALGSTLFFWSRVAYAAIYIAGIPYLRSLAFLVSFVGMLDIVWVLLAGWGQAGAA
jgi:uncharacterized MAPEG superfamily protein